MLHSPDPGPELVAMGYRLVLAGHTHGGQVRMPVVGALVTNGTTPVPTLVCAREGRAALIGARQWIPADHIADPVKSLVMGLPPDLAFRTNADQPMPLTILAEKRQRLRLRRIQVVFHDVEEVVPDPIQRQQEPFTPPAR